MTDTEQGFFDLTTTDFGVEQAEGADTIESSVAATHPDAGGCSSAQGRRSQMGDVREPVEPIRFDRREQTLVLAPGKGSARDTHHRPDMSQVLAEHSRECFERSVRQTMTDCLDEVLALHDGTQDGSSAQQLRDPGLAGLCHMAQNVSPNGS